MPGFLDNPNTEGDTEDGMYTHEMVCAVAAYASTLQGEDPPLSEPASPAPTVPPTTTTTVAEGEEEPEPPEPAFCSDEALDASEEEEDS
jgi:hypothetical protein